MGSNTTGTLSVTPTTSTSYTVSTNTANCGSATVTQVIRIIANELTASASPASINTGNSSTLSVSGGTGSYQWFENNGNGDVLIATTNDPSISVSPTTTTQYTVRGTTATGSCVDDAITRVTVDGVLPVTLIQFSATAKPAGALIKWATAMELNNAYFEVQRSANGQSFTAIGKVQGSGTTSNGATYSFSDTRPLTSLTYYRLRQVDLDGTSVFSSVVTVTNSTKPEATFYPNPSNTSIMLPNTARVVQYRVYTATGRTVLAGSAAGGSELDIRQVPAGLYFLELIANGHRNVQRFVRQ
ncbi:T9SS type A sorting domain-containing protein [Hymenobacter sp. ISL-91]|uniref:T9SS type A sorting domain-containing protein n=1 Tax=Hymenobacter sp. ISL-91 TaxID=2819151 RepID=UPI001BE87F00|nr:T9SS type A sorting domain-containing protein [Hymenobacter sp. ISL-91]MBT2557232.1 T9SS type A sorting domain-containing protein [Hymenobacter sp. ISL-91]